MNPLVTAAWRRAPSGPPAWAARWALAACPAPKLLRAAATAVAGTPVTVPPARWARYSEANTLPITATPSVPPSSLVASLTAEPAPACSGRTSTPPAAPTRPYHHGDLYNALLDAATELAREGGPDAVVLRGAARQVGVSHNAGYRHFASRDVLLEAVAHRGLARLADTVDAVIERTSAATHPETGDPKTAAWALLRATGQGYLNFALAEPGLFRTAFVTTADPQRQSNSEARGRKGRTAWEQLTDAVDGLVTAGAVSPGRRVNAEMVAWSTVHGLAVLATDGPLRWSTREEIDAVLDRACEVLADGL